MDTLLIIIGVTILLGIGFLCGMAFYRFLEELIDDETDYYSDCEHFPDMDNYREVQISFCENCGKPIELNKRELQGKWKEIGK